MDKIKSWLIELHDLARRKELEDSMKSYGYNVRWIDYITCMLGEIKSESWEP